jgi:two-component system OmpR family sensor kinase/two-component system sensor histidine kinase BaeS
LVLAFAAVGLIGVVTVALLANRSTRRELQGFMFRGSMTDAALLAEQLAAYYQGKGSWEGVEALLGSSPGGSPSRGGMGRMMNLALRLAEPGGLILADTRREPSGVATQAELEAGVPVVVDGETVGVLLSESPGASSAGSELLARVNRGILIAALLAALAALLAGWGLAAGLIRPLRELTQAARQVSHGEYGLRVPARSGDEIGLLAQAFNQMSAGLERTETLRRDMTADIAHELRNPLAILQAQVEALMDGVHQPTAENLQAIQGQTALLAHLVEDLRTMALADAGQLRLEKADTELVELASKVVEAYRSQARQAGIRLSLQGDEPVWADVDGLRLEQALGNLLSNALRHTPADGEISVRVHQDAERSAAIMEVADTGEGIPEEALPSIFERFYRSERSGSRREGGTGLGLAITRRLVESHHGWLKAANRPGGGAVFTLGIPLRLHSST